MFSFFFFAGQFNKTCARLGWNVLMVSSQQRSSCFLSVTVLRSSTFAVSTLLLLLMINTNIFRTSPSRGWEGTISNPALQFYYNQPNFEIQNTVFQCRQVEGDVIDLHLSQFTKPDKKCNASKRLAGKFLFLKSLFLAMQNAQDTSTSGFSPLPQFYSCLFVFSSLIFCSTHS